MPQHTLFKVHIADGFKEDCEELVQKCLELETLNFYTFSNVWKDMNMGCIYYGRQSGAEIAELSEEVIHVAKEFMLTNSSNFKEIQVGLYTVYALLTQQPFTNFAWLRVTPDDVTGIKRIESMARSQKQHDVLYILGTILIKHTQYHATERERGFDATLKKYMDGCTSLDRDGLRPKGVFYQQNDEVDMLKDLGVIARRYAQARKNVTDIHKDCPSINYINENLAVELHRSLKNVMNGPDDADPDDSKRYEAVQSIKQKAMVNTVNPMGHLTSAEDRKRTKSTHKSDIKTTAGKIKTCSPTKTVTSSPLKRKQVPMCTKPKKAKTFFMDSIYESDVELNLKSFNKEVKEKSKKNDFNSDDDTSDSDITSDDEINSKSDENESTETIAPMSKTTYPAVVHSKAGEKYCEIEVLDYATDKTPVQNVISDIFSNAKGLCTSRVDNIDINSDGSTSNQGSKENVKQKPTISRRGKGQRGRMKLNKITGSDVTKKK